MNAENLKKLFNELTDIIAVERRSVFIFISLAIIFKLAFYWLERKELDAISGLKIVKIEPPSPMDNNIEESSRDVRVGNLVPFYPASAGRDELIGIGFSPKVADILINYRTKGGQFRTKGDVKKIYGVSEEFYKKIEPYILLETETKPFAYQNQTKEKKIETIDINTADKEAWKALPGIGDYFAQKFIDKRNGLGAYVDIEQIAEVYNLPDSTFQKIRPYLKISKGNIKKININTATESEVRKHPYILRWQADDIMRNRPIYGINDLYELKTYSDKSKNKFVDRYFEF